MLQVTNLSKSYGKKIILDSIDFSVPDSSCVGIVGNNGSGKSTLLSILAGVLKADSGTCFWNETNLFKEKKLRAKFFGYVPQNSVLFEELSALDNLKLWHSGNRSELIKKLENCSLRFLQVSDFLDLKVSKLSGGMKKRLSIACAALGNPKLLILDEPSSSLDNLCKEQIRDYINAFRKEGGSILLVTHDTAEMEICDECFLLSNGVLAQKK